MEAHAAEGMQSLSDNAGPEGAERRRRALGSWNTAEAAALTLEIDEPGKKPIVVDDPP